MGPRRDWRGYNDRLARAARARRRASMGPRRDWRGYHNPEEIPTPVEELQWGHAVIGVDTANLPSFGV